MGVLGLAYVMRGIGDTSAQLSWLSWLSPLGWVHSVRAFAGNRWPVLALLVGFAGVMALVAYAIAARRDFGAGVLADRPGPARAQGWLGSTVGLAWRLERGALIAWVIAFAILGLVVGGVAGDVGKQALHVAHTFCLESGGPIGRVCGAGGVMAGLVNSRRVESDVHGWGSRGTVRRAGRNTDTSA